MEDLLCQSTEEGIMGLSTHLVYTLGARGDTHELARVIWVARRRGACVSVIPKVKGRTF